MSIIHAREDGIEIVRKNFREIYYIPCEICELHNFMTP